MKRIDQTEPGPNIAGISLVLYLLVSVLSMMAAYEAGKTSDELRNSLAYNIQSNQSWPTKGDGDDADEFVLVTARSTELWPAGPIVEFSAVGPFRLPAAVRAFDARGPPCLSLMVA